MIVKTVGDGDEGTKICSLRIILKRKMKVRGFFQLIVTHSSGQISLGMMLSKSSDGLPYFIQGDQSV